MPWVKWIERGASSEHVNQCSLAEVLTANFPRMQLLATNSCWTMKRQVLPGWFVRSHAYARLPFYFLLLSDIARYLLSVVALIGAHYSQSPVSASPAASSQRSCCCCCCWRSVCLSICLSSSVCPDHSLILIVFPSFVVHCSSATFQCSGVFRNLTRAVLLPGNRAKPCKFR